MSESADKTLGQVKWFNNKSGYGFITSLKGNYIGKDIFVHHSDLLVGEEQYRYLIAGEYVEFNLSELSPTEGDDMDDLHKYKATNVKGVCGGSLMCEVRKNLRMENSDSNDKVSKKPTLISNNEKTNKEWMVVRRNSSKTYTK